MAVAANDDQTSHRGVDEETEGGEAVVRESTISDCQLNDGEPKAGRDEEAKQSPTGPPIEWADSSVDPVTGSMGPFCPGTVTKALQHRDQ